MGGIGKMEEPELISRLAQPQGKLLSLLLNSSVGGNQIQELDKRQGSDSPHPNPLSDCTHFMEIY